MASHSVDPGDTRDALLALGLERPWLIASQCRTILVIKASEVGNHGDYDPKIDGIHH